MSKKSLYLHLGSFSTGLSAKRRNQLGVPQTARERGLVWSHAIAHFARSALNTVTATFSNTKHCPPSGASVTDHSATPRKSCFLFPKPHRIFSTLHPAGFLTPRRAPAASCVLHWSGVLLGRQDSRQTSRGRRRTP